MPELALPEVSLHYEIEGAGPPVLLLAGMLSDSASWGPIVGPLAECFTVIRPDNRTTGRTRPWDAPASIAACADDAARLLEALDLGPAHVIGHSMGALMAAELAGRHPALARSLVALASAPLRLPRLTAMFDTLLAIRGEPRGEELWLRALYPWAFRQAFFEEPARVEAALQAALDYPHAQTRAAMAHQLEMLKHYRPSVRLEDLALPALAVLADDDLMIPQAAAARAWSRIAGIEIRSLADAGHSLHWDNPEGLLAHLLPFLQAN